MPALGSLSGAAAAAGVVMIVDGWRGHETTDRRKSTTFSRSTGTMVGLAVVAALLGWVVTGWPAVGALAASLTVIVPRLLGAKARRDTLRERSEALASWAEMLRDSVSAHAGLREASSITAKVAPRPIRVEVQRLAARA